MSSLATNSSDYLEKMDEIDERFTTVNVPISSIATSTGQNDSGVFELNFKDERYLPFEGAGVISKWRLELPEQFRQFDYDTISDVVLHVRYTAMDGGDKLKQPAAEAVQDYIKSVEDLSQDEGLFAVFDLKHDFATEWHKAMQVPADATERILMLNNLNERLPIFTRGRQPNKIQASDVYLFTASETSAASWLLSQGTDELSFTDGPPMGSMTSFAIKDADIPATNWQLKIQDLDSQIDKTWLLVRYVLK